jgi:uncharacterized membrane protein YbhN (UPF0104 family)
MTSRTANILRLLLGLVIVAALIYHIQARENLLHVLLNARVPFIILGMSAFVFHYFWVFMRWRFVVRSVGNLPYKNRKILSSLFGGSALGLLTPGRVGELGKGVFFPKNMFWQISGLSVIDKGYAHVASILLGVFSITWVGMDKLGVVDTTRFMLISFLITLLTVGLILIFRPGLFVRLVRFLIKILPHKASVFLSPLAENLSRLNGKESFILAFLSIMVNLGAFIEFVFFLNAFTPFDVWPSFLAFEAAYLTVAFLPFSFSDLGIREGVRIFYFGLFGCSGAAVLNASLLMFLINSLIPAGIGLSSLSELNITAEDK